MHKSIVLKSHRFQPVYVKSPPPYPRAIGQRTSRAMVMAQILTPCLLAKSFGSGFQGFGGKALGVASYSAARANMTMIPIFFPVGICRRQSTFAGKAATRRSTSKSLTCTTR